MPFRVPRGSRAHPRDQRAGPLCRLRWRDHRLASGVSRRDLHSCCSIDAFRQRSHAADLATRGEHGGADSCVIPQRVTRPADDATTCSAGIAAPAGTAAATDLLLGADACRGNSRFPPAPGVARRGSTSSARAAAATGNGRPVPGGRPTDASFCSAAFPCALAAAGARGSPGSARAAAGDRRVGEWSSADQSVPRE